MNCELCRKELEAYREGKLPESTNLELKKHLDSCPECAAILHGEAMMDHIISHEKTVLSNPFLSTRVMAEIEKQEAAIPIPSWQRALKPVLVMASIVAAITIGVISGNLYYGPVTETVPVELAYMDDAAMELVNYLSND